MPKPEYEQWAKREWPKSWRQKLSIWVGQQLCWINRILFGWSPSIIGFLLGSVRLLLLFAVPLAPAILGWYKGTFSSWPELVAGAILGVIAVLAWFYDRWVPSWQEKKKKKTYVQKFYAEVAGNVVRLNKLVKSTTQNLEGEFAVARRDVLNLILQAVQIHFEEFGAGYLEVSLLVFLDQGQKIQIAERATRKRPTGKVKDAEETLAFYVARERSHHRVIHDFQNKNHHPFPPKGLSEEIAPYRSIMLIPLVDKNNNPSSCPGVVTIDSEKPYHFLPGDADDLLWKLHPYCAWLIVLLKDHKERITY